jgi:hypothetical protein
MHIVRSVSKTVKDSAGKDFKRSANITFEIPEKLDDVSLLISSFGSVQKLAEAAYYGVFSKAKVDANNELMKGDKVSKALKKMIASLQVVMKNLTAEQAVKMIFDSNPEIAKAFAGEPLVAEIEFPVDPATISMIPQREGLTFVSWLADKDATDDETEETDESATLNEAMSK